MKVRVSYGVELEELPKISEELLNKAIGDLSSSIETLKRSLEELSESNKEYYTTIRMIERARMNLSSSDLILSDIQSILDGLDKHYNGEKNVSEGRPTMDPSGNIDEQT